MSLKKIMSNVKVFTIRYVMRSWCTYRLSHTHRYI